MLYRGLLWIAGNARRGGFDRKIRMVEFAAFLHSGNMQQQHANTHRTLGLGQRSVAPPRVLERPVRLDVDRCWQAVVTRDAGQAAHPGNRSARMFGSMRRRLMRSGMACVPAGSVTPLRVRARTP